MALVLLGSGGACLAKVAGAARPTAARWLLALKWPAAAAVCWLLSLTPVPAGPARLRHGPAADGALSLGVAYDKRARAAPLRPGRGSQGAPWFGKAVWVPWLYCPGLVTGYCN